MAPPNLDHLTTDPEYIELLNYIIRRTENVESPIPIKILAREFKGKSGAALTAKCFVHRIQQVRKVIHNFKHIDTKTKVKLLFALSASINPEFLKELEKDAVVEVDDQKRITLYKAKDGSLELWGDHSRSAKTKTAKLNSKGSHQKLIRDYFENKNNSDAVPENDEEREMWNFLDFITEKSENVNSPLSITRVAKEYIEHSGIQLFTDSIRKRIRSYCFEIQKAEFLDTQTSAKQLFGLSATVTSDYLEKLRKDAHVEVDKKNRLSYYKAKNGDLELRGDHSTSLKVKTGMLASKRSFRSLMKSYFGNKNDADAVPKNEKEKEMRNLIEFITEKCENVNSPLNVTRLAEDLIHHFDITTSSVTIRSKIRRYCQEIQTVEFLDNPSKVKQLFGLGATLDSNFLKELREDADVEVDDLNRITKYTANNSGLTLCGDHSRSAKKKAQRKKMKHKNTVKKQCISGGDTDEESEKVGGYSDDDSDEYSSEEFGSEFDSDDENDHLDKAEDLTKPLNKANDFDNETPVEDRLSTKMSIDYNLDIDPPTERGEDQENDPGTMENTSVKTRYGRLSKKRHLDAEFSYNLASSRSSGASMNTDPASSKPAKQKKIAIDEEQASISLNQSRSPSKSKRNCSRNSSISTFPTESEENMENRDAPGAENHPSDFHGPRNQEMEDYDYDPREDNAPDSSSIDNRLEEPEPPAAEDHNPSIEAQNTDNRADAVASEPEPVDETLSHQNNKNSTPPTNGKKVISQEVPINVENGEPKIVKDHPEDIKPKTAHNPKIKFFEAMQSLILFLDTPSLSKLQSKIQQRIRKIKGSKEVLQNNELIPALELLVARMINHSVIDISNNVETVSLIQFFCYLKASLLNSKMTGLEDLTNNISGLIEKSQNK
ncbi:unnamed protein product, partial [Caenorhabditis brenneri]